jgi:hypothetical protein
MPIKRIVRGNILKPDLSPNTHASIKFRLNKGSFTQYSQVPKGLIPVLTDTLGNFQVELWANEEGTQSSTYTCYLPDNTTFDFTIHSVGYPAPIELSYLREAGIVTTDPQYPTLTTYVNELIANTAATSITKAFSYGDASPVIVANNFVGFVDSVEIIIDVPFDVPGNLIVGDALVANRLLASNQVDTTYKATYESNAAYRYTTGANILLTITPGIGTTQGSGYVVLNLKNVTA